MLRAISRKEVSMIRLIQITSRRVILYDILSYMQKYFLYIFITFGVVIIGIVLAGMYRFNKTTNDVYVVHDTGRVQDVIDETIPTEPVVTPPISEDVPQKLKADVFIGTLEKVDTGCFADGECFVEVEGKHVTVLMGWNQETVGSVTGVSDFGSLENYIGKKFEVYAQQKEDGTYTLYGSEGFYVKPITTASSTNSAACVVGGCSGQLCVEAGSDNGVSTCEWQEVYACYKTARCERQATGQCGWTQTEGLLQCLDTRNGTLEQF